MADEMKKCAHEICVCAVGEDQEYCSESCQANGESDITDIACDCGHGSCGTM